MEPLALAPAAPVDEAPIRAWAATSLKLLDVRAMRRAIPLLATATMATAWAVGFGYLAVSRHLAGGSHAEDLGFTDQVLWNFLRGQWFRMSIYHGATWNTELDLSRVTRPDSLLAFHVEPMLLAFVPLYALGAGATTLLILQSTAVAAGAVPAYRLGRHWSASALCGVAVAAAYLLSPLGQWAVLADFHTSTLAAPLLLFSLERLVVARRPLQALVVAVVAASAREDVGPVLVCLGLALLLRKPIRVGAAYLLIGATWTVLALLVIRSYSGGFSPFDARYAPAAFLAMLARPGVIQYATTLLLGGAWLGLLAPMALLPALPSLAINALSTSPWMATGQAHYSGLVLPFVALGAAAGFGRLRGSPRFRQGAACALLATALIGYIAAGAGPLAANYAPAVVTDHAMRAAAIAADLPPDASVSATSSLVPRVSHRANVYVFPAVLDAEYVFLDLQASPAPTSAGDVYLRAESLMESGDWQVQRFEDGLVLLHRRTADEPAAGAPPAELPAGAPLPTAVEDAPPPSAGPLDAPPRLLSAALVPSPDGALGVDGPHWILRTVWQDDQPLPAGTHLDFWLTLRSGEQVHVWDIAQLWWNPPERWPIGQPITVDVPDVPIRQFASWSAGWTMP